MGSDSSSTFLVGESIYYSLVLILSFNDVDSVALGGYRGANFASILHTPSSRLTVWIGQIYGSAYLTFDKPLFRSLFYVNLLTEGIDTSRF